MYGNLILISIDIFYPMADIVDADRFVLIAQYSIYVVFVNTFSIIFYGKDTPVPFYPGGNPDKAFVVNVFKPMNNGVFNQWKFSAISSRLMSFL